MLKNFLEKYFGFCNHQWKTIDVVSLYEVDLLSYDNQEKHIIGKAYYLECKKCGNMKKKTFTN